MKRHIVTDAIILNHNRIGEFHKGLILFSANRGLINCIAHGAYKGKNRMSGITDFFCYLRCYLYRNPVKESYKLSDAEPLDFFPGLRNSMKKFFTASLWAEILLKSFGGGGNYGDSFHLLSMSLSALDQGDESACDYISFQFLWRLLGILGEQSDLTHCGACHRAFAENTELFFSQKEHGFLCASCATNAIMKLPVGARKYLEISLRLTFQQALKIKLERGIIQPLKQILFAVFQKVLDAPLETLKSGEGIL